MSKGDSTDRPQNRQPPTPRSDLWDRTTLSDAAAQRPGTGSAGTPGGTPSDAAMHGAVARQAGADPGRAGADPGRAGADPGRAGADPGTEHSASSLGAVPSSDTVTGLSPTDLVRAGAKQAGRTHGSGADASASDAVTIRGESASASAFTSTAEPREGESGNSGTGGRPLAGTTSSVFDQPTEPGLPTPLGQIDNDDVAGDGGPLEGGPEPSAARKKPRRHKPNSSFGDYVLIEEIARGGMGAVFRAKHRQLDRVVALKMVLLDRLSGQRERERFRTEVEAVARLEHPHIIPLYEVGEVDGQPYFTMKLVEGGSLSSRRDEFALPLVDRSRRDRSGTTWSSQLIRDRQRKLAMLMIKVCRAVHHAHQRGLLHRDLKPGNILMDGSEPLVTDFGIAKRLDEDSKLTMTGAVIGTPAYMSPEQAEGHADISVASDVFSLGAILYDLLTGRPPFQGDSPLQTLGNLVLTDAVPPSQRNASIDRDVDVICMKCLRRQATQRYGSAAELADDLQRWLDGLPITARQVTSAERLIKWMRRRPGLAAAAGFGTLAVVGVAVTISVMLPLVLAANNAERLARQQAETSKDQAVAALALAEQRQQDLTRSMQAEQAARAREGERFDQLAEIAVSYMDNYDAIANLPGAGEVAESYVASAIDLLNTLAKSERAFPPTFVFRLARSYTKAAQIRLNARDPQRAIGLLESAIDQFTQLDRALAKQPPQTIAKLNLSNVSHLATAYALLERASVAISDDAGRRKARAGHAAATKRLAELDASSSVYLSHRAKMLLDESQELVGAAQRERIEDVLALVERLKEADDLPTLNHMRSTHERALNLLSEYFARQDDFESARRYHLERLSIQRESLKEDPLNLALQMEVGLTFQELTRLSRRLGEREQELAYAQQLCDLTDELLRLDPTRREHRVGVLVARHALAKVLDSSDPDRAEKLYQETLEGFIRLNEAAPRQVNELVRQLFVISDLAELQAGREQWARAIATVGDAISLGLQVNIEFTKSARVLSLLAELYHQQARYLVSTQQFQEAANQARMAADAAREALDTPETSELTPAVIHKCALTFGNLGRIYQDCGQVANGLAMVREAQRIAQGMLKTRDDFQLSFATVLADAMLNETRLLDVLDDYPAMNRAAQQHRATITELFNRHFENEHIRGVAVFTALDRASAAYHFALLGDDPPSRRVELLTESLASYDQAQQWIDLIADRQVTLSATVQGDERVVERTLNRQLAEQSLQVLRNGEDEPWEVVLVTKLVLPGGQAEALGLQAGDVLRSYLGQPMNKTSDLRALHGRRSARDGEGVLVIERQGVARSVKLRAGRIGISPMIAAQPVSRPATKPAP